jgi:nicotinate-nucleotide adenylyltransferase
MTDGRSRIRVGLLGGSFDPVHVGHLALGQAAAQALELDRMIVMPTGESWQKTSRRETGTAHAQTPAQHRLAMMQIALNPLAATRSQGCDWVADDLEVRRSGPSYTIDTLQALRERLGPDPALILILGSDQLQNLATWHRWRELLDFAHIAATQRERVPLADLPAPVEHLVRRRGSQVLSDAPAGSIVFFRMPAVAVSATGLRAQLARGEMPEQLLPPGVPEYIRRHHLYDYVPSTTEPHRTRANDN